MSCQTGGASYRPVGGNLAGGNLVDGRSNEVFGRKQEIAHPSSGNGTGRLGAGRFQAALPAFVLPFRQSLGCRALPKGLHRLIFSVVDLKHSQQLSHLQ